MRIIRAPLSRCGHTSRVIVTALSLVVLFGDFPAAIQTRETEKPLWIVVTAPAFRDAIKPLCVLRESQGMRVVIVKTDDVLAGAEIRAGDGRKLRERIRALCGKFRGPRYVLLVGATGAIALEQPEKKVVPALRGTTGRMKGKPTDHGYGYLGDPAGDLRPEVAVGRIPARTQDEAKQMVAKTIAFETDSRPGAWRRRMTVLAGAPGFGPFVDKMVESLAFSRLAKLDGVWEGRAIYHNPSSFFTLPDDQLHDRARAYVEAGQALTIYLGHSNASGFYGGRAAFLDRDDWSRLTIRQGPGIFVSFGCYGCQVVADEGYCVSAIRNRGGPAAVMGSLGECYSTMALPAAESILGSCGAARLPERIGAAWLKLHSAIAEEKTSSVFYSLLDAADGNPSIPRETQRREHLEMFILFGDPALKLPQVPADIELTCADEIGAGKVIAVRGRLPPRLAKARLHISVQRPLNSKPADLEPLPKEPASARARALLANHERANRFAVVAMDLEARNGRFEAKLKLPAKLPWRRLTLRVYAQTDKAEGIGTRVLTVKNSE